MDDNIESLKNLLLRGNPVLFTGAGFSKFAKTKDNNPLPDAYELKQNILKDLLLIDKTSNNYKELLESGLSDICEYCNQNLPESRLIDYLVDTFSNCVPAPFHYSFGKYKWKKIYTTNIDDVIENSFDSKLLSVQNMSRPKLVNSSGKIEYLKLHGCVRNSSGKFVFDSSNYIDSLMNSRDYRFNEFGQDIQFSDFIFIGTQYNEINLDFYLKLYESSYGTSSKGRLFFINPKPSIIFKSKINKVGGKIVEWTTEQFAEFLEKEIIGESKNSKSKVDELEGFYYYNKKVTQFADTKSYSSNLYLGFEPKWLDIFYDWDFINYDITNSYGSYRNYLNKYNIRHSIFTIVGKTMVGKSVYLKRLAHELYKDGFEVFEFSGKRFDYYLFNQFIRYNSNSKFCLLIDNASYYYGAIRNLLKTCPKEKTLLIITTSRPFFHSRKKYNLITEDNYEYYIESDISNELAEAIEIKLDLKGYLAKLKGVNKEERITYIKKCNDISSLLYQITYGKGFLNRYNQNIEKVYGHLIEGKEILIILSVFQKLDLYYFPLEILTILFQSSYKKGLEDIEDFIKYNDYNGIELRNNFISNYILKKTSQPTIINLIKKILITISPQVTEEMHSYWNEMQASLMKEKLLRLRLNLTGKQIKNLLFDVQNYYNDNYNYWIQVGLSEQIDSEYEKALNHFQQAESLSPNSYMVKNAIARNFLKQAVFQKDYTNAKYYFEEGEKLIISLIQNREEFQVKAFSTHSYIYEKIKFLKKFHVIPSNEELKKLQALLNSISDKGTEDPITKHISNYFYNYLKEIKKTNIIKVDFHDLSKVKSLFDRYDLNSLEVVFEEVEIDA